MIYGIFLWITLIVSIVLLFILEFKLVTYLYNETPLLVQLFKEYRNLKKTEKDFLKYYKNTFK